MRSPRGGGPQGAGFRGITVTPESGALVSAGTPQLLSVVVAGGKCEPAPTEGTVKPRRGLGPERRANSGPPPPAGQGGTPSFSTATALGGGRVERRCCPGCRCHCCCRYHRRPAGSASQPNAVIHPDAAFLGAESHHEPSHPNARPSRSPAPSPGPGPRPLPVT